MSLTTKPKRATHHRKIKGEHHRHSKHYVKTYMPYLPLLILVVVGLAINTIWTTHIRQQNSSSNLTAIKLLDATNHERTRHKADNLELNHSLNKAAQSKAHDMARQNYWAHNAPDGKTPWTYIQSSGYAYYAAAENLAYGFSNAPSAVTGWMNSADHRNNMLNQSYQHVGYGIATADNFMGRGKTTIIVALYAEPQLYTGSQPAASKSSPSSSNAASDFKSVSRVELLTGGNAPWSVMLVAMLAIGATLVFIVRHGRAWHRVLVQSEEFIVHHKTLDVLVVTVSVAGFILTRTAGHIH